LAKKIKTKQTYLAKIKTIKTKQTYLAKIKTIKTQATKQTSLVKTIRIPTKTCQCK
jgi:hypothetical protein